jgi:hypothetical protein
VSIAVASGMEDEQYLEVQNKTASFLTKTG